MTTPHYIGAVLVLLLITGLGVYAGSRVKSSGDFTVGGRRAGAGIVAGSIIGTFVGGASTIGTAQLAFNYGFSAWWFTLGGGIGCLILALCYAKPLHDSGVMTLPQMLSREYGRKASTATVILTSLGSFLSIVAQLLASVALITSISGISGPLATLLTVTLMIAYVLFGGVWGAGIVGMAKTALLFAALGISGILAFYWQGGLSGFTAALPADRFFSLVARGAAVDLGAGLSIILGVLASQSYIQAILSARTVRLAKSGALISAALIPLVGTGGIFVGLYMRLHAPDISSAAALPLFVLQHLPPLFGGVVLATLLITVVGTAAGIALGLSAMFCNDIYLVYWNKNPGDKKLLLVSRLALAGTLLAAALFSTGNLGSLILTWSFLALGLRGVVPFGALTTAIAVPGRIPGSYAFASMLVGPAFVMAGKPLIGAVIDPLFFGLAASLLVLLAGYLKQSASARQDAEVRRSPKGD